MTIPNDTQTRLFRALADRNRLNILKLLETGEKCSCHILENLSISQPALSHHMKILCESGITKVRKHGRWTHYSIVEPVMEGIIQYLTDLVETDKSFKVVCKDSQIKEKK